MNPERLENKGKLLFTLGVALIYFAIMFAVAELLPRLLHADREDYGAYQVMMLFSNIGFMGYPLLDVMYGSNAIISAGFPILITILEIVLPVVSLNTPIFRQIYPMSIIKKNIIIFWLGTEGTIQLLSMR